MGFCTFLVPVRYLCLKCEILWLIPNGNLVVEKGNRIYQKSATFSFWPFTILFLSILGNLVVEKGNRIYQKSATFSFWPFTILFLSILYCKLWYTSLWFTLPIESKSSPV